MQVLRSQRVQLESDREGAGAAAKLLSSRQFALVAGISERAARMAFEKAVFRGEPLPVAQVPAQQGGKGGMVWALHLDGCSPALQARLGVVEAPVQPSLNEAVKGHVSPWQWDDQADKHKIIAPILDTAKRSPERTEAFRRVAVQSHMMRGKLEQFAEKTLRDWVRAYERIGMAGLLPAARSDKGKDRCLIVRPWDKGIDLTPDAAADVARKLAREARSMVFNDGTSVQEVLRISSDILCRLSAEAGSKLPLQRLRGLCQLNKKWAARVELDRYRAGYRFHKDHKAHQDFSVGRTQMALTAMPMDLVQGDVHYVDILVKDEGEPIRVRLIAWLDMSSMFLWVTPVLLSKGRGVVQADVAQSLFDLATCPHGGVPKELYLDNGSEYSALSDAMKRLAVLSDREFGLTLAKPYSPTSKGSIEGLFNILERILKGLPGWIGGRRDNKKSANKGRIVEPYSKGLDQLIKDILACVSIYNSRRQSADSRIAGLSPKAVLELKAAKTGFKPRILSDKAFDLIFSRPATKVVRQSSVQIGGRSFDGDYLHQHAPGEKVEVLVPLREGVDHAWINVPGGDPALIQTAPVYAYGDRAGAVYQAGLEAKSNAAVRALSRDIDRTVSTFENQKLSADMSPPKVAGAEVWTPRAIDKSAPRATDIPEEDALLAEFFGRNKPSNITPTMRENQRRALKSGRAG